MSVFIKDCNNENLDINKDYGILSRVFNSTPRMIKYVSCSSSFFMIYVSNKILPHRKTPYRNHFVLYKKNKTLVIALTETLLDVGDILPIIEYDIITVEESKKNLCGNWYLSYDKISYSCNLNVDLQEFDIVSSGEWWYFDKGRILNGINENDEYNYISFFIYYELYPSKIDVTKTNTIPSNKPPKDGTFTDAIQLILQKNDIDTTTSTTITTSPIINDQYLPVVNNIIKENGDVGRSLFETVVPSAYWLMERDLELQSKDISYFTKQ